MCANPIRLHALVTPVDQTHPWFGQPLIVTNEVDTEHVCARMKGRSRERRFKRVELTTIASTNGVDMARAIGKHHHLVSR